MKKTLQRSAVKDRMNQLAQTPDKFVENVAKLRQQEDSYHVYAKKALRGDKILQEYEQSSAKMKHGGMRHQLLAKDQAATANMTAAMGRSSLSTGKSRIGRKTVIKEHECRLENVANVEHRASTKDARGRKPKVQSATVTKKVSRPQKNLVLSKQNNLKSNDASPMSTRYGMQTILSGLKTRPSHVQYLGHGSLLNDSKLGAITVKNGQKAQNNSVIVHANSNVSASSRQKSSQGTNRKLFKSKESSIVSGNSKSPLNSSQVVGASSSHDISSNEMRFSFNNPAAKKRPTNQVGAEVSQNYFHQQNLSQEPVNQKYEKIQKKSLIQQKSSNKHQAQMQPKILRHKVSEPAIMDFSSVENRHNQSASSIKRSEDTLEHHDGAESELSKETMRKKLGNSYLDQMRANRSKSKQKQTATPGGNSARDKSYSFLAKQKAKSADKNKLSKSFVEGCGHHKHERQSIEEPEYPVHKEPFKLSHNSHNHHGQSCEQQVSPGKKKERAEKSNDFVKRNKKQAAVTTTSHYTSVHKTSVEQPRDDATKSLHYNSVRGSFNNGAAGRSQERALSSERYKFKSTQLIMRKFGAVLIGYKTRRIFNKNRQVIQLRTEFRDLIQFAYQLKQELAIFQDCLVNINARKDPRGHAANLCQQEQTRKLLLQSLKDLISKRQQFQSLFNRLNKPGTDWMVHEAHLIQQFMMNSQKLSQNQKSVRSPKKTATATITLSSRRDELLSPGTLSSNQRQQQAQKAGVLHISPPKAKRTMQEPEDSPKRNFSPVRNYINSKKITQVKRAGPESQEKQPDQRCEQVVRDKSKSVERKAASTINMLNQRIGTDEKKPRVTRESRKNQLTFGMPTKNISRAESTITHLKTSNRESTEETQLKMAPRIMQSSSVTKPITITATVDQQEDQAQARDDGRMSSAAITPTNARKVDMNSSFRPNLKKFIKDYQSPYRQAAKSTEGPLDGNSAYNGSCSAKNFVGVNLDRVNSKKDVEETSQNDSTMPVFESKIPRLSVRENFEVTNWKFKTFQLVNKKSSVVEPSESKSPSRFGINLKNRRGTVPEISQTHESGEALNIDLGACPTYDMREDLLSDVRPSGHSHLGLPSHLANTQQYDNRNSNRQMRISKRYEIDSGNSSPLDMMVKSQQAVNEMSPIRFTNQEQLEKECPASPSMGDCMSPSQGLRSIRTKRTTRNEEIDNMTSKSMRTIEALQMMDDYVFAKSPIKKMNFENQYLKPRQEQQQVQQHNQMPSYQLIQSGIGMFDQQSQSQSTRTKDAYHHQQQCESLSPVKLSASKKGSPKKSEKENSLIDCTEIKLESFTVDNGSIVPRLNIPQSHQIKPACSRQLLMDQVMACGQSSQMSGSFRLNPCEVFLKSSMHSSHNQSMAKINEVHLEIDENESPSLAQFNHQPNVIVSSKQVMMAPKLMKSKQPSQAEMEVMQQFEEDDNRKRRRSRGDRGKKVTKSQAKRKPLKKSNSPKKIQDQEAKLDENSSSNQHQVTCVDKFNSIMDISRDSVPLGGRDVLTESPSIVNTGSIEVPAQAAPVKQSSPLKPNHYSSYNYNSSIISKQSPIKKLQEKRLVLSPVPAVQHDRHCSTNVHQDDVVSSPAKTPVQKLSVTPQRPSDKMRINNDATLSYQPAHITTTPKPNRTLLASGGSRKRLTQGKRSKEAYQLQRMQSPNASLGKVHSTNEIRSVYREQRSTTPVVDQQERLRIVTTIAQLQEVLYKMGQSAGIDDNAEVKPEQVQAMIDNLQSQLQVMDQQQAFDESKSSHSMYTPNKLRNNSRGASATRSGVDVSRVRF